MRAKRVAKRNGTTPTHMARDGLRDRVEALEARERTEKERAEIEYQQRRQRRRVNPLGASPMAPTPMRLEPRIATEREPAPPPPGSDDDLYERHARIIAAALGDPLEQRIRVQEAVVAIKKRAPLTSPSERDIISRLEFLVIEMCDKEEPAPAPRPQRPQTRIVDDLVGLSIANIPSFGDARGGDEEQQGESE